VSEKPKRSERNEARGAARGQPSLRKRLKRPGTSPESKPQHPWTPHIVHRAPYRMLMAPAAMLGKMRGTKNGDTRRAFPDATSAPASATSVVQLMPLPTTTPVEARAACPAGPSAAPGGHFASASASSAATSASTMNREARRTSCPGGCAWSRDTWPWGQGTVTPFYPVAAPHIL
jgi:hypothetical protein